MVETQKKNDGKNNKEWNENKNGGQTKSRNDGKKNGITKKES